MASISISGSPSTTNNSITINYTTSGISNITNVQLSKDGGSNYINPMSFSNTSATFNVGDWSNGTYSNCVLKVTYTDTSGDTGTTTIPCTGITLSSNSLTFTNNDSQTLTATVTPSNTTDTVSWSTNSSSVATVSNGVVTPQSNGSATITASCGSHSASCSVTVNIAVAPSSYTITYNLSNCYSSNTNSSVTAESSYSAYLTPNSGYTLGRITVTMGEVDVTTECTSSDAIYIPSVIGNIVINCTATQTSSGGSGGDSGGSGGTVDTNLSATILNMQYASSHEAIPNIPSADWKYAPRLSDKGATLPVQNCSDCASGTHSGAYNAGSLWSAFGQWATIYKVADTSLVENVGVEITDFKMWRYNPTTNQWILVNEGFDYGAFYLEDFWDDGNAPLPNNKVLSNDKKTYKCLMNSATAGRCFHPFSPQINWADVGFSDNTNPCYVVSQMKARLIVWDSSGSDNRASANLCANVGGDYWIYKGATYDNQWRHNGDFAIGYFKKLTNDWQYIYATTCPSSWDKGFPCDSATNSGSGGSSSGGSGSTGGGTVSNESSWANGVPYTFNWVDGEYVSNNTGEFRTYDSDSRTPKLYCYGAYTIEVTSNSEYKYSAWYTSDGTFINSFTIPGTVAVPSNAHYFAVSSKTANKSSVTITPHS